MGVMMAGFGSDDESLSPRARMAFARLEGITSAIGRHYPGIAESLKEAIAEMHAAWYEPRAASRADDEHQRRMEG